MACKYFDTIKKKHYIYDRVDGSFSSQIADMEYYVCKGTDDRAICTCGGDMTKCDYYMPSAIKQLSALAISRDVIDQLYWDDLINEDDNDALRTIWLCAEREIRSAKCLE